MIAEPTQTVTQLNVYLLNSWTLDLWYVSHLRNVFILVHV